MKILTVGGAMIDTIAVIANDRIERMTMRNAETSFLLMEEGRKVEADEVSTHCGGGAVNAAVACARLGHDVAALIKLGQDARADTILRRLTDEGVSTRFAVRDARAPTGASVLVSAHDRNAAVFTFRGANTLLEAADIKADAFAVDLVYVAGLSNESAACFPPIIELAKSQGAMVATNPGIRQLSARQGAFRDLIAKIDILTLNRVEAGALVPWLVASGGEGGPALAQRPGEILPDLALRGFAVGGFELSLAGFVGRICRLGPQWVVITDGRDGAYIGTAAEILHCPAAPATIVGSAGAGDAYNATFAAIVAAATGTKMAGLKASGGTTGANVAADAAVAAATNAASVIAHLDTQTGLLTRAALDTAVRNVRTKLQLRRWAL